MHNCKGYHQRKFYIQDQRQYPFFSDVNINSNEFKVKTGEPDMLNPSCFENISQILFNIAERAGINSSKGARQWLFLECDGGIYYLVEKLIFSVIHCDICKGSFFFFFFGNDVFLEHKCSIMMWHLCMNSDG